MLKSILVIVFVIAGLLAMLNTFIGIAEVQSVLHQMYLATSIIIGILFWMLAAILNINLNFEIKDVKEK